jgi:hypothetical protein
LLDRLAGKLNFTYHLKLGSKIPELASLPEVGQAYDNSHPPANSRAIDLAIKNHLACKIDSWRVKLSDTMGQRYYLIPLERAKCKPE